jgi:hypothetical protein
MLLEVGKQKMKKLQGFPHELSRIDLWKIVSYSPRAVVADRLERPVLDQTFTLGWIALHEAGNED